MSGIFGSPFPNCRKCPMCTIEWPYDPITMDVKGKSKKVGFMQCPECGEDTKAHRTADPLMNAQEAATRIRHIIFNRFYEVFDERRTGESPDEIGREEGRILAEQERERWEELRMLREMWNSPDAEEPVL